MTRKEKIKLLRAIQEGKISVDDFQPPKVYFFTERSDKPGIFEHEGNDYTETEYREFCDKVKRKNNKSIFWIEGKEYPPQDTIITLYCASNPPLDPNAWNCTLDLSK